MRRICRSAPSLRYLSRVEARLSSSDVDKASGSGGNVDFGFQDVDASAKEGMVKEVFSKVAENYDLMNDAMSLGMHRLWKDFFVQSIGIKAAAEADPSHVMRHLDVAGGTGDIAFRVVRELAKAYPQHMNLLSNGEGGLPLPQADRQIVVCDINAEMLKVGARRAEGMVGRELSPLIGFVEGNAEALPFQDTSFDLYSIAFGLRNVTDKPKALREAHRVLRRGGRLMVLEFSHLPNPLLQSLYDSYSFNVIPRLGELISKDADSYQYLVESIRRFPKQARIFNNLFRISSYCLLIRRS